jgi:hypothetical protein
MAAFDPYSDPFAPLPSGPVAVGAVSETQRQIALASGYQEVGGFLIPPLAGGGSGPAGAGQMSPADRAAAGATGVQPVAVPPSSPPPAASSPPPRPSAPPSGAAPAGPIDPVNVGLADGTFDLAAYEAAMNFRPTSSMGLGGGSPSAGGPTLGPPPGSPPNSIVAPDSQAARDNAGPPDVPLGGPGTPGYTGNSPEADPGPPGFRDTDGNGIDDREQTTVDPTSFGLPYGQMQGMPTLPTGWGSASNTGMGGFVPADGGGGSSLGGYGTDLGGYPGGSAATGGPASGGNFTLPGGSGGFNPSAPPTSNLPDVSQIGTGVTGGGTAGGVMGFPDFQNPLTGTGGTGTGTGTGGTGTTTGGSVATGGTPVGNTSLVGNLANSYQGAIDSANAANENRFATGLELLLKRAEQAGMATQGLTYEGMNDIGRMFGQQRARSDQDLINRGLSNTTVREGIMRGYATDEQAARNRYADDQTRKNIDENFRQQQGMVDWLGARNDVGPDVGQLANLASGVGAAGPGASTGTAGQTTGGTAPSQQTTPTPVGNVVNTPTSTTGQRLDVRMDANGNITQSVGGQPLSGPQGSNGTALTRGVAATSTTPGMAPSSQQQAPSSLSGYGQSVPSMQSGGAMPAPVRAPAVDSPVSSGRAQVPGGQQSTPAMQTGGGMPAPSSPMRGMMDSTEGVGGPSLDAGQVGPTADQMANARAAFSGMGSQASQLVNNYTSSRLSQAASQPAAQATPEGFDVYGQRTRTPLDINQAGARSPQAGDNPLTSPTVPMVTSDGRTLDYVGRDFVGSATRPGVSPAAGYMPSGQQPPSGMASGGAMLRNGQIDQNTNDNPATMGFGTPPSSPQASGGMRLQDFLSGQNPSTPDYLTMPSGMASGGSAAYSPPAGMAQKQQEDRAAQLQSMNSTPPASTALGKKPPEFYSQGGQAATTGSQSLLGVMGNYGSSPSGATPAAPPPAMPQASAPPMRAFVNDNQPSAAPAGQTAPSWESRYTPLPQRAAIAADPRGVMAPQVMQNGQMVQATFLPNLGRYGVLS